MKLARLMQREGVKFEKVLIPSNSGLSTITPDVFRAWGLEKSDADRYYDENLGVEVIQYRGEDIPDRCDEFTRKGIPVVGMTGDDLFDEYKLRNPGSRLRLLDTVDWITLNSQGLFTRPTLCLHR